MKIDFEINISSRIVALARRYELELLRFLEAIEIEQAKPSHSNEIISGEVEYPNDVCEVASETGLSPSAVLNILETEQYYRDLSSARCSNQASIFH